VCKGPGGGNLLKTDDLNTTLLLTLKVRRLLCIGIRFSKYKVFRSYVRRFSRRYIIEFSALDK